MRPEAASRLELERSPRSLVGPVLAVLFPSRCVVCRRFLVHAGGGPLCVDCFVRLPRHGAGSCGCGAFLASGVAAPCGRCRRGLGVFESGASLGPYEGSLRTVLHALKYSRRLRLAGRLAEALSDDARVRAVLGPDSWLVPVPLHARRLRERGFNQSEAIARALGRRTGRPVLTRVLVRQKDTPSQAGLTAAERRRNVLGAFWARACPALSGGTVVLVDDVLTTGATARACATALRRIGAANIRILTVARVA